MNQKETGTTPTVEELDATARIIHQWIQGETDYRQEILFDLPPAVYQLLLKLTPEEISSALEDLAFCEMTTVSLPLLSDRGF